MRYVWKAVREDLKAAPVNGFGERPILRQCRHNHMTYSAAERCMMSISNEHCGFNGVDMVKIAGNGRSAS